MYNTWTLRLSNPCMSELQLYKVLCFQNILNTSPSPSGILSMDSQCWKRNLFILIVSQTTSNVHQKMMLSRKSLFSFRHNRIASSLFHLLLMGLRDDAIISGVNSDRECNKHVTLSQYEKHMLQKQDNWCLLTA